MQEYSNPTPFHDERLTIALLGLPPLADDDEGDTTDER